MQWVGAQCSALWVCFLGVGMVGKEREERSKCEREREVEEDEVRYGVEGCITPVHAMASMCQGQEA